MPGDDLRQSSIAILDVPLRGLDGTLVNYWVIQEPVFPFITADGRIVASSYGWTTPTMPGSRPAMTSLDSRSVWNFLPSSVRLFSVEQHFKRL
ncbi:hypothetical protein CPAR01_10647 [Colletotrichum paranaense]|uniref:Uncharacterized protein n=1 Tax=Colletotrichum paranaense TaxID=1914294 RepID=A0ABQ9SEM0_9PEZI|nr:uncharacterized protein CPAR01_10647 [Colletotrichum paranaense]KAK1533939.1 hypothetical protein CPAR01_10647 [Colletotrichum paranaense]